MITHIVLLQPKPETSERELYDVFQQIQHMQDQIPGIINIKTGRNLSSSHQGYTHGFFIQFASEELFRGYAPHPAHKPVSDELQRICQSIIDFDV
jgi:Stress responsive A/B Barrel Domain